VTLANTLADQLNIPLAGIHLSDIYGLRAKSEIRNPKSEESSKFDIRNSKSGLVSDFNIRASDFSFLWLHSTKATSLFIRGFGNFAPLWPEPVLIALEDLLKRCPNAAPFCGELIPQHQAALAHTIAPMAIAPLDGVLPSLVASLAYGAPPVLPWYGRGW
jgi:hypothetical protein